ncbi:reprolysin-like metallopeptidase [Flavobacterium sp.]|uniref:zinc-dependent metalloprotease n=1 Tax=Flavobacterium sp. TaxID=239 RepID=UPI0038FC446A
MKKQLLTLLSLLALGQVNAQSEKYWSSNKGDSSKMITDRGVSRQTFPKEFKLFNLNADLLHGDLFSIVGKNASKNATIISLPNADGGIEQYEIYEASNFETDLQAQFPEIRAYSGKGITDKYATIKLSVSPQGINTMIFRTDKENEFIEPYSQDHRVYAVYKSQRQTGKLPWSCGVDDKQMAEDLSLKVSNVQKSSAGQLKVMRLAQSCTGEYSVYFANKIAVGTTPTTAITLAAVNTTLTRCNGVYEKDLGLHLNLVNNTTLLYLDPATDPYSDAGSAGSGDGLGADGAWNGELQSTITSVVGAANYDIGHLFGASGGGGNAGCIGCVCVDASKGSGFTSPGDAIPEGDNFDIDYVVHEVGHQLGGNHTFTHGRETGSTVQVEPGSGVTIMGYAGITSYDFVPHSIDKYHAATIAQIQANLSGKTCPVTTNISANNATPVAGAGVDYTIPKSTPFLLTGTGTDANAGDALTYSWEQMDALTGAGTGFTGASSGPSATKATGGANWRSFNASSSPSRNFPLLSTTLSNLSVTPGLEVSSEALSSVARTLNFRLTVRDNAPYSSTVPVKVGQTNFDDMVVTVSGTVGPFDVTSQATVDQTWIQGSTQTITWAVGGTNVAYAANVPGDQFVDILLSTDGGLTFPTVLVANTANDGTQTITVPNVTTTNARVMVKAHTHIFYDINPQPIAIGYTVSNTCNTYTNTTPLAVPDGTGANVNGAVVSNTIAVPVTYNLTDVDVSLNVSHTWPNDLVVQITHPNTTTFASVWNRSCAGNDNFNITMSDGAAAFTCVANMTGTFSPASPLSVFNGLVANGTWRLTTADFYNGDTGTINSWGVTLCNKTYTLSNDEFEFTDFNLYPNPNNGSFAVKFTSDSSNDIKINVHDMRGRQVYEKSFSNTGAFNQNINLNKVEAGIYLVSIVDGAKKTVKRIVVQ